MMFFNFINIYFFILNISASILFVDSDIVLKKNKINKETRKISDADIKIILNDSENIISNEFDIPAGLESRVMFWTKIYAIYPSTSIVIHDRSDLAIVYTVLDYSKVWESDKYSKYKKVFIMQNGISSELSRLRKLLFSLINKNKYNQEELKIINMFSSDLKKNSKKEVFTKAIKDIRAQTGQKNFFINGIRTSGMYMEQIDKIFFENNLPMELSKLPFVESSYNFKAISKVGATGLWQIIDETGEYYLELNKDIDERISPVKASTAAAKILKTDYKTLKSWPLAVTAYNFGAYRLKRAVKKLKTKDIVQIINNFENPYFGFAAKNFYAEFLAALHVYTYHELFFGQIDKEKRDICEGIILEHEISINQLCAITDLDIDTVSFYNPDLMPQILDGKINLKKGYEIRLPKDISIKLISYFIKNYDLKKLTDKE